MSDPCSTVTNYWLPILTSAVPFVLGFATAVFSEPFRQWMFRPKIELTFRNDSAHVTLTPISPESEDEWKSLDDEYSEAYFIRIGVLTKSRRQARKCRAYLVNVERKVGSSFEPTLFAESIQLPWAGRMPGTELEAIDIPHGIEQYVDLIATYKKQNIYKFKIKPLPLRDYVALSRTEHVIRLTIQTSGDGLDPVLLKVVFCWKGQWNEFDVYKEE